jgi:hypothetical protein
MEATDCQPIQSDRGRIRDSQIGVLTRIYGAFMQADSPVIELLAGLVESASVIGRENRVLCDKWAAGMDRLRGRSRGWAKTV